MRTNVKMSKVYYVSVIFIMRIFIFTGKRPGLTNFAQSRDNKKLKEERGALVSALAPLVAYGEGDSSDEDDSQSPDDRRDVVTSDSGRTGNQPGGLPFWAVRRP